MMHLLRIWIVFCSIACCNGVHVIGANPSLEGIAPSVGTRGKSFIVVAKGASLANVKQAVFYDPGIQCETIEAISDEELQLHLVSDLQCNLGPHAFRLLGENGFSELRTVTISPFPTIPEDKEALSQSVPLNSTLLGTLESDDVDSFRIHAKKGERISAEVLGIRLGISLLDTTLTLRDSTGRILKRVDDTPLLNQDPAFSILAPEDGEYSIEITTAGANADADSQYALHLGNFPRPYSVFPLGVRSGTETDVLISSSDIDQSDVLHKRMSFDTNIVGTTYIELAEGGVTCPSPIPFRVSNYEQTKIEGGLTHSLSTPVSVHGVIREASEVDTFQFTAAENGTVSLEVFASRLGSLLDAVVEVRNQNGQVVSSGDDFDSHDPRLVFDTQQHETYTVAIRDKRKNFGNAYSYCIEIGPLQKSLTAFMPRRNKLSQAGQTVSIPRGNRSLALIGVRRDRLDGEVSMAFDGLPTGVSARNNPIASSSFLLPVVLWASDLVPASGSFAAVNPSLQSSSAVTTGCFEQIVDLVNGPADAIFQLTKVDRLAIATVPSVPYSIEMVNPSSPLAADGTLEITIQVKRENGFDAPIDVTLPLLPDWVDCQPKTRIPANQDTGRIVLRANRAALAGQWPLVAEGVAGLAEKSAAEGDNGTGSGMSSRRSSSVSMPAVCTSLQTLTLSDSPAHGSIGSLSVEQGTKFDMVCRLELEDSMPESLVATLEDLPNRVRVEAKQISRSDKSVTFQLNVEGDAPIGTFESIVCRLSGTLDNQKVSYCVARDTKLIIAAPGASQKDESGRPLSQLEALRLRKSKQGSK